MGSNAFESYFIKLLSIPQNKCIVMNAPETQHLAEVEENKGRVFEGRSLEQHINNG